MAKDKTKSKVKNENVEKAEPTRERILREAMRLFAEKGYERTSVGDIQKEAGLTFGSGALYKHFSSKQAVLEAGVWEFIETGERERTAFLHLPDDFEDALNEVNKKVLASFKRDRETLRVVWRELEHFPELIDEIRSRRIQPGFKMFAEWLDSREQSKAIKKHDAEATAVVLLGALVFYRLMEALLDETPGKISEERFAKAWTELAERGLKADG